MLEPTAYQRSRLAADEQVFWCGTTRPVARFAAWPLFVVFGVVAGVMFSPFFRSVWGLVRRDETPTAVKIVFVLFSLPFAGVALGFLLSPLWHWIRTRGSVWMITDRRVIRFFGPFARSWGYDKLFEHVEWSSSGHGCLDFAFSEHWVSSKGGGYMTTDCIENVRKKDVPFVKAAFQRLTEYRQAGEAARQAAKMSVAEKCFHVRESAKRLSIVFRRRHAVHGCLGLLLVLSFFVVVAWLLCGVANEPLWILALFPIPMALGCFPYAYYLFGRREIVMESGQGYYFNGVWPIGIFRRFTYGNETRLNIGTTRYRLNGRSIPEVQLSEPDRSEPRRLFADSNGAVIKVFVRHMSRAMRCSSN